RHERGCLVRVGERVGPRPERGRGRRANRVDLRLDHAGVPVVDGANDRDRPAVLPRVPDEELLGRGAHWPKIAQPLAPTALAALFACSISPASTSRSCSAAARSCRFSATKTAESVVWKRRAAVSRRVAAARSPSFVGSGSAASRLIICCCRASAPGAHFRNFAREAVASIFGASAHVVEQILLARRAQLSLVTTGVALSVATWRVRPSGIAFVAACATVSR